MTRALCALALVLAGTAASAGGPDADGPAGFTTDWHGHGSNHQGNNEPGDTAADRHNFNDAEAGKSGKNPKAGDKAGKKK